MRLPVGWRALGLLCALASASAATVAAAGNELPPVPRDAVTPLVPSIARSFDLADVTLGPGPFRDAMERDRAYLLRLDPDHLAGSARARDVLAAMADWVAFRVDRLTTEQMQAALGMELGGMNDVLAGLYALTGEPKHLRGEGLQMGTISGRTWREAPRGASFGYTLATGGREDLSLHCVVGARDRHRRFDVWVEGMRIEPPELDGQAHGLVRLFSLPVPAKLSRGKTVIRVRFQARDDWDATSANLFECLLVPGLG